MNDHVCVASSALTHPGQVRSHNEDYVQFFEPNDAAELEHSGRLYILADGVGGAQAGERASRYACEQVMYEYYNHPEVEPPGERLWRAIRKAGNEIYAYAENRNIRMATTIVAVVIRGTQLTVAHVGDSRCYLIRNGKAHQLTTDHTEVEQLVQDGLLSRAEADKSSGKNRLSRSVGGETDVSVDVNDKWSLHPGDKVLLCSDGLTRYASQSDIEALSQHGSPEEIVKRMIDFANTKGGGDNISAIMVIVQEIERIEEATARPSRGVAPHQGDLGGEEDEGKLQIEAPFHIVLPDSTPYTVPISGSPTTPADSIPTVKPVRKSSPVQPTRSATQRKRSAMRQSMSLIVGGIALFLVSMCVGMLVYFWLTRANTAKPTPTSPESAREESQAGVAGALVDEAVAGTRTVEVSVTRTLAALSTALEAERAQSGSAATQTAAAILQQQSMDATMQSQHATETVVALTPSPTLSPPPIQVGSQVRVVAEFGANIRKNPGLGEDLIFIADQGKIYRVEQGPQQKDQLTWWYIVDITDNTKAGWAAELAPDGTRILEANVP